MTRGPRRCHPLRQSRIAHDYIYPNPQEGDDILIEAILNIITEIKKKG